MPTFFENRPNGSKYDPDDPEVHTSSTAEIQSSTWMGWELAKLLVNTIVAGLYGTRKTYKHSFLVLPPSFETHMLSNDARKATAKLFKVGSS